MAKMIIDGLSGVVWFVDWINETDLGDAERYGTCFKRGLGVGLGALDREQMDEVYGRYEEGDRIDRPWIRFEVRDGDATLYAQGWMRLAWWDGGAPFGETDPLHAWALPDLGAVTLRTREPDEAGRWRWRAV
jgi:hypothetical protein